jgi:BMFP domain-containing protein YqiC
MNEVQTSLENRVVALEARVVALESLTASLSQKTKRAESFARDASLSQLNSKVEVLSLIEDHVEVLKLIHNMVGPADRLKNKQVLTYIQRAESKLAQFQARFAQLEAKYQPRETQAPQNPAPEPAEPRRTFLPKPFTITRLLRPAAWWNA